MKAWIAFSGLFSLTFFFSESSAQNKEPINPQLHTGSGDVYIENFSRGVVMKSPNGTCWRIQVNNDGQLITTIVPCLGQNPAQNKGTLTLKISPTVGQDNYINSYLPAQIANQYEQNPVGWWTISGVPITYGALLQFEMPTIPTNATIDSAYLYLYHYPTTGVWMHSGNNAFSIRRNTTPWKTAETNWANRPITTTANQVLVGPLTNENPNLKANVTLLVKDMYSPSSGVFSTNFGFSLDNQTPFSYSMAAFGSGDCPDETKRPKLVVYYTAP